MLIYPGKVLAKKDKESRKWAMMTEASFFWTKPRVKEQQRRVEIHSWPRFEIN